MMTAHYTGDGTFGASNSTPGISVTVTPESTTMVTLTAPVLNFNNGNIAQTLATPSGGKVDFGDVVYLRADIKGVANVGKATGTVTFTDGTTTLGTVGINAKGYAEFQTGASIFGSSLMPLAIGAHSITAAYSGDASYAGTTSAVLPITVQAAPTTISLQVSANNITPSNSITVSPGTFITVTAFIDTANSSNPSGGSFGNTLQTGADIEGTVAFTIGNITVNAFAQLPTATVDANGFIASSVYTYYTTPMTAQNLTISATFTPSNSNYLGSATSSTVSANVANNEGFTIDPAGMNIDCSQGFGGPCLFIPAVGKSATSPVTVTSIGLNGTVTLSCAVTPTNPADLHVPGCSFTLNGAANSTISLNGNFSSGQRMLTITTTAASVLAPPARLPQEPCWIFASGALSAAGFLFLLLNVSARRPRLAAVFALLLVIVAGAAVGCGGSNSGSTNSATSGSTSGNGTGGNELEGGNGSGGGSTSSPGTTADIYTVTVTATPSAGTSIQTQFEVFVQ